MIVRGGPNGTTQDLADLWRLNVGIDSAHARAVTRAIELELMHRPVRERIDAGYPK